VKLPKSGQITIKASELRATLESATKRNEDAVEAQILKDLNALGFVALHASTRGRGAGKHGGNGADKGFPDITAFIPGCAFAFPMEVKKDEKAARTDEQVNMNRLGCYPFVWSTEMAIQHLFESMREILKTENDRIGITDLKKFGPGFETCFYRCAGYIEGGRK
jgi:hypothetical protein